MHNDQALARCSAPVTAKTYCAADDVGWRYPEAGDPTPPGGAKCLLLTRHGICVTGPWAGDGRYLAWSPMPRRNKDKESQCSATS